MSSDEIYGRLLRRLIAANNSLALTTSLCVHIRKTQTNFRSGSIVEDGNIGAYVTHKHGVDVHSWLGRARMH